MTYKYITNLIEFVISIFFVFFITGLKYYFPSDFIYFFYIQKHMNNVEEY